MSNSKLPPEKIKEIEVQANDLMMIHQPTSNSNFIQGAIVGATAEAEKLIYFELKIIDLQRGIDLLMDELTGRESEIKQKDIAIEKLEADYAALQLRYATVMRDLKVMQWVNLSEALPECTEPSYWYNDENVREIDCENDHATVLAFNEAKGIYLAKYNRRGAWSEIASFGSSTAGESIPSHWTYTHKPGSESSPFPDVKREAIAFAEWLSEKGYEFDGHGLFKVGMRGRYTASALYGVYLVHKGSSKEKEESNAGKG